MLTQNKTPGQAAYEAYNGEHVSVWQYLTKDERARWEKAALAGASRVCDNAIRQDAKNKKARAK